MVVILSVFSLEIFVFAEHWLVERQRLVRIILRPRNSRENSREDMWPFSRVSISCRMATLYLSRELSAKGSALNIKRRMSSGIFFRSMGISKLPYDSVITPSVSKPRILASHKSPNFLRFFVSLDGASILANDSM